MRVMLRMTVAFVSSNAIRAAIAFATAILIARQVGAAEFGRWTLSMTLASTLAAFLDLGFGVLLTRDAARSRVRNGTTAAAGHAVQPYSEQDGAVCGISAFGGGNPTIGAEVSNAVLARVALLAPMAALVMLFSMPGGRSGGIATGLVAVVLLAGAGAVYGCFSAALRGWPEWLVPLLAVETGGALAQFAGSWWIAAHQGGFIALLWLATAVQAAQIAGAGLLWTRSRDRHDALEKPTPAAAAALVRRSLPFAVTGLVANAQLRLAPLGLGYLATVQQVALFGAAQRLASVVRLVPQAAFASALPVLAYEVPRGTADRIRVPFGRAILGFAAASASIVALFAPLLVRVAYGRSYEGAASVLACMGIGLVPELANNARKVYLYAAGHEQRATLWSAAALGVQAIGCAVLIPPFGAAGAAAAVGVSEALVWWPLRRSEPLAQPLELAGRPVRVVIDGPVVG
jgi:O-antigen/teichoic acid export membrane protein